MPNKQESETRCELQVKNQKDVIREKRHIVFSTQPVCVNSIHSTEILFTLSSQVS